MFAFDSAKGTLERTSYRWVLRTKQVIGEWQMSSYQASSLERLRHSSLHAMIYSVCRYCYSWSVYLDQLRTLQRMYGVNTVRTRTPLLAYHLPTAVYEGHRA